MSEASRVFVPLLVPLQNCSWGVAASGAKNAAEAAPASLRESRQLQVYRKGLAAGTHVGALIWTAQRVPHDTSHANKQEAQVHDWPMADQGHYCTAA